MAEAFPASGNIEPASFPHLLVDLHSRGATGSLKATGPSYPKALYFRGGRILFGSSNDPRDQLGAILIESGRISRLQLDEVNAKVGPGNPLAKVLSESGFVNQRELGEAAHAKVERILADLLSWDSGTFEFEDGVLPKGAPDLKLSTEKLLFAAVQRIPDRAFALRHVDLHTVLEPAPEGEQSLGEVRAEVWPLLERLDGKRTLKDAIALTRLDEFEAAKTACALLFLGIVRPASAAPELDLAQEAQNGFGAAEPEAPSYITPLAPAEPSGFAFAEPEDEPPVFAFEPEPPPPQAAPEDQPAAPDTLLVPDHGEDGAAAAAPFPAFVEAEPAPEPVEEEPLVVAEAPHDLPPEEPTFIMPPNRAEIALGASAQPARAQVSPDTLPPEPRLVVDTPSAAASRPSREDLAALDALLSPAAAGRAERPAERPQPEKWEPQFRPSTQAPRRSTSRVAPRAGASRLPIVAAAIAGVVLATVGAWYFLLRGPTPRPPAGEPRPTASAAVPVPVTTNLATPPAATLPPPPVTVAQGPPAATLSAAAPRATPALPAATPVPTPTPAAVQPPTTSPPAPTPRPAAHAASASDARSLLGQGSFPEAARSFATSLSAGSRGRFSLQLLTACAPETVQKALGAAGGSELFILPVSLQGRSCYRLCWGVYDTRPAAEAAVGSVPAYFRQGGTRPRLSALSELLP